MSHLGRETFLTSVTWKDGWPYVGGNKLETIEREGSLWAGQERVQLWSADFSSKNWEAPWLFLRERRDSLFKRGDGKLSLIPSVQADGTDIGSTFAAVRPLDFECIVETELRFCPEQTGDEAGLLIYLESKFHYRFCKKRLDDGVFLVLEKTAEDFKQTICFAPVRDGNIWLRIECDREQYHFYYALEGGPFTLAGTASTRFLSCEIAGKCFTGTVVGLYALAQKQTSAYAEAKSFSIGPVDAYK